MLGTKRVAFFCIVPWWILIEPTFKKFLEWLRKDDVEMLKFSGSPIIHLFDYERPRVLFSNMTMSLNFLV